MCRNILTLITNNGGVHEVWKISSFMVQVVPFTPSAGVLEWVDGTLPLGEYLTGRSVNSNRCKLLVLPLVYKRSLYGIIIRCYQLKNVHLTIKLSSNCSTRSGGAHSRYGIGDWQFLKCREHMTNVSIRCFYAFHVITLVNLSQLPTGFQGHAVKQKILKTLID